MNKKSLLCTLKAEKISGKLSMATLQTKPSGQQMNNIKKALLIKTSEHIDEEVTLLIDGSTIVCFANVCPYELKAGKTYSIELKLNLPDNYSTIESSHREIPIEKIGKGFAYNLYGELHDDEFHTFTVLFDEGVHYDHPAPNNKFIRLQVERIDASFL